MPPPPRCVSVLSDNDSSDEVSQISTPPTTSESGRGEETEGAARLCQHAFNEAEILRRHIDTLHDTIQNASLYDSEVTYWKKRLVNLCIQLHELMVRERCQQCSSASSSNPKEPLEDSHQPRIISSKQGRLATVTSVKKSKIEASASDDIKGLDVTNVSLATTANQLRLEFERFGDIADCYIIYNSKLGWSKVAGYVEFANSEDAARAKVYMDFYTLGTRVIRVYFSDRKHSNISAQENPIASAIDEASRHYAVSLPRQGTTPESSRGQGLQDAKKSKLLHPQPSYAASTLQIKINSLEQVLRHTPFPSPERRQNILGRRLDEIYVCYLTLKGINRELRWSDLPLDSLGSLKELLRECAKTATASKWQAQLAYSVSAEEVRAKFAGLSMFNGGGSLQMSPEDRTQDTDFESTSDLNHPSHATTQLPVYGSRRPVDMLSHPKVQHEGDQLQWKSFGAEFTGPFQSLKDHTLQSDQTSRRYAVRPAPLGGWPDELEIEVHSDNYQTPLEKIFPNGSPQLATFEQVRQQLRDVQISDANEWDLDGAESEDLVSEASCSVSKPNRRTDQEVHGLLDEDAANIQALITSLENEIGKLQPSEPIFVSRWRILSDQYDLACDRYREITDSEPEMQWTAPEFSKADITNMMIATSPSSIPDIQWALSRMNDILAGNGGANSLSTAHSEATPTPKKSSGEPFISKTPVPQNQEAPSSHLSQEVIDKAVQAITHFRRVYNNKSSEFTAQQDEDLLALKTRNPDEPWHTTAKPLGKSRHACKERYRAIALEHNLSEFSKKQQKKLARKNNENAAKADEDKKPEAKLTKEKKALQQKPKLDAASSEMIHDNDGPFDYEDLDYDDLNCGGRCSAADFWATSSTGDVADAEGWGSEANAGGFEERCDRWGASTPPYHNPYHEAGANWSFPRFESTKTPEPAPPALKPYTVTYWATIECDGQEVHIPIDSNNVSGPEKTVLDGPAKTVWKWAQEKGLCDKISLRDAFDLAKDMTVAGADVEGVQKEKVRHDRPWHGACSPSAGGSWSPSPRSLSPSLTSIIFKRNNNTARGICISCGMN